MRKSVLFLFIFLFNLNLFGVYHNGQFNDAVSDGPYILLVNDSLRAKMIENSVLKEYLISQGNFSEIKTALHLSCNYNDLIDVYSQKADFSQNYQKVDSIIAISDVHGQYKKFIDILTANGVIDRDLNWKFGKGHLVFLGDAFDRGDMVTELLWYLFALEKQAQKAGGMVHVLLGNHEDMVFSNDLRYMNEKYKKVEEITKTSYTDLYSENTVLGKWLRNQPAVISINDILFVHAGISVDLVRMKLTAKQINKLSSGKIIGKSIAPDNQDKRIELLAGNNGPFWYRGYFADTTFSEFTADSILRFYSKNHIIVGHTTFDRMQVLFNKKIIGIDAGIGYDGQGEVLIIKNRNFYTGSRGGKRTKL